MTNAQHDFATMQDFLLGRLSSVERRAFEDRLVREPQLVRELEQTLRLREGLRQLRGQGYFSRAAARDTHLRIWAPVLAAAAVAAVAVFLWLFRVAGPSPILLPSPGSHVAGSAASPIAAQFTFVSVRGDSAPELDLPAAGWIEIRAAPGARLGVHGYRATLARQAQGSSAELVAELSGLVLGADGYVHCYADASRLTPGSYVLRIETDTNTADSAETFSFKLRARNTETSR